VAEADGRAEIVFQDSEPLRGSRAAWASKGMDMRPGAAQALSRSQLDYSFNEAPAGWRVGAGVWEVTNRWECDPRWNFMTGMPPALARRRARALSGQEWMMDSLHNPAKARALEYQLSVAPNPGGKLAALWHKRPIAGDFAAEAFMSPMMDGSRQGNYEAYAQNFCLTVCGDGKDVSSGYALVFGGWGNTRSAILRQGAVVAETPRRLPVGDTDFHRKWLRVRAEREGAEIRFQAWYQERRNGPETLALSLSYADPDPLPGGQVALWTWDNGLVVARARLAAEVIGPAEPPLAAPAGASAVFYE
jgi:hypothetical protein